MNERGVQMFGRGILELYVDARQYAIAALICEHRDEFGVKLKKELKMLMELEEERKRCLVGRSNIISIKG